MSTRASLIYILIGIALVGYVGLHWVFAEDLDVTVERRWTGETKGRWFRSGTANFIGTERGEFGFFGTPFTADSDEMYARLPEGQSAQITVIDWLHGPLWAEITGRPPRRLIVEVH